jgi:Helicase C-terminal domain/Type III restriction enzyme, res subunit
VAINQDYAQFLASFASDKFRALWPAQAHVLQQYAAEFTSKPDVAIELPTGAGKTLIALLSAEAWRQEDKKVAILSANKTLARQMMQEAQALNIPAVLMEGKGSTIPAADKRAYQRKRSIAVMNYWVYFNQNPILDPADLLIMDDAHLAEHCLHSLYSVEIDRHAHESLFKTLITELHSRFSGYRILDDALADDAPASFISELLSFLDQAEVADRFREIVDASPFLHKDTDLNFRWRRIRQQLREANIYVSQNALWIRPYIYPLIANSQYEQTEQRLYMSATVGDPSDLSRRLGTKPIEKIPVPPEYIEKTAGRRFVIMGTMEEEELSTRVEAILSVALHIHPKSVWLCSSKAEAFAYQERVSEWLNSHGFVGHPTWLLTPLGEEIDDFKKAPRGHLFVGGRFDGMDFRADECRIVVVTTLPRATNLQEAFIAAYLRDASFMKKRLNQRIVQALGRCNRSDEDFGLYILADQRFATHFSSESNREGLQRNIIAEIDMAQDSAESDLEKLVRDVEEFLRGDFTLYDNAMRAYLDDVPVRPIDHAAVPDTSSEEVRGWTALFDSLNYQIAANRFEECWTALRDTPFRELGAFHGWHWAKALYLQSLLGEPAAGEKSLQVLEEAITHGGQSGWFNRMRASLNRARRSPALLQEVVQLDYATAVIQAFDEQLERLGTWGDKFERWCSRLTELLAGDNHKQYQEGLEKLGQLMGYRAVRPRNNAATDCLWRGVFGNAREIITFEAKIEHDASQQVAAKDIGQAHNQRTRAEREYSGFTIRATIVTHLTTLAPDAESAAGSIKILEKEAVLALWDRVRVLLSRYRGGWSLDNIAVRLEAAQAIRAHLPNTGWLIKVLGADQRFITASQLCADWL